MKALIKTTNPVLPSFVIDLLAKEGIQAFEFDQNICIVDGSIGIFPRRIMVADDDFSKARWLLQRAGLGDELETA